MNELIKIERKEIGGGLVQTVNARELHVFLKVCEDFKSWIKDRLDILGSQYDLDYLILKGESLLSQTVKQTNDGRGGHNRLEYFVTLETAKYLAMMEKTDRGNEARDYLIQCQKNIKQVGAVSTSEQLLIEQIKLFNRVMDEFGDKIGPRRLESFVLAASEKFLGLK